MTWMAKIFSSPRLWATSEDFYKEQNSTASFFHGGSRTRGRIQPWPEGNSRRMVSREWNTRHDQTATTKRRFRRTSKETRLRLFIVNVLPVHLYRPPELKHYSSEMDNRTVDSIRGFKRSRLKIDGDGDLCRSAMSFDLSILFSLRNLLFLRSAV